MILYTIALLPPCNNVQCTVVAYHYTVTVMDVVYQGSIIRQMREHRCLPQSHSSHICLSVIRRIITDRFPGSISY